MEAVVSMFDSVDFDVTASKVNLRPFERYYFSRPQSVAKHQ
jgi:hypothetical protein